MLVFATQTRHPLDQLLAIPYLDLLHPDPGLDLLADQPRRHRIRILLHANGTAPLDTDTLAATRFQTFSRQRTQQCHLLTQLRHAAGIALGHHALHQVPVLIPTGKVPTATQQQSLIHRRLEMTMR
jgi:hypothetical protein